MSKSATHYYPSLERPRQVHVYTPAVPLRAVSGWVTDDGEEHSTELAVLGIEASIADCFEGPKTRIGTPREVPRTLTTAGIRAAGYRPELYGSERVRHRLVVWGDEFGAPEVIDPDEPGSINAAIVAGPASRPSEWWSLRMTEAAEGIRKRLGIAEPGYVVAERMGTEVRS